MAPPAVSTRLAHATSPAARSAQASERNVKSEKGGGQVEASIPVVAAPPRTRRP